MKKRSHDLVRRLAYCVLLTAAAVLPVVALSCSLIPAGTEIGVGGEYKGHTITASCKKQPDGTWSCGAKVHVDADGHELEDK